MNERQTSPRDRPASSASAGRNSLASLAWRNLWRNRRRTLITLGSIVFGVFLAVLMTAMQDRNWNDTINLAARVGGGHVTVQHRGYEKSPTLRNALTDVGGVVAAARQVGGEEVTAAVPRIVGQAMVNSAYDSYGAAFIAFDPGLEDSTTLALLEGVDLPEEFVRGENAALMGHRLAENLGLHDGDKVVYTLTDRRGDITSGLARLRGTVRTGSPTMDAGLVLLPIQALRQTVGLQEGEATQVALFLADQRRSARVAEQLQAGLPEVSVLPWSEARPDLAMFIAMKVGGALFMEMLIAILVAAGIFNTLFVNVMERLREFGILRAIGWTSSKLFQLVMLESLFLGVVGLFAAALLTIGPYFYLANHGIDLTGLIGDQEMEVAGVGMAPVVKVGIFPENAAMIAVFALLAVMLAGIYPALKAGRVEPVEAIKLV